MKMEPGWHTYWRNPGDAGLGTVLDWDLPDGFDAGPILWPFPERIEVPPLVSYGYEKETYLLVQITPPKDIPSDTVTFRVQADWLVCREICLPGTALVELTLDVDKTGARVDPRWLEIITQAKTEIPIFVELSQWSVQAFYEEESIYLEVFPKDTISFDKKKSIRFFPYDEELIVHSAKQEVIQKEKKYILKIARSKTKKAMDSRIQGILVSENGWRGDGSEKAMQFDIEIHERAMPSILQEDFQKSELSLGMAVLFAFVGGLILNLMPCVFPVLSIKILSFVKQAHEDPKRVMIHGWFFAGGILVSFWILAGLLIVLRAGGEELGWGFQLQSPYFLCGLIAVFFLFGLNLFGVFEIGMTVVEKVSGVGRKTGLMGSFLSGVVATVVATPCTAPFMGSALGFALSQPAIISFCVFTGLGLGLSAPYLVLTLNPKWIQHLPKPGPWMVTLKQFMGFLLVATVIWLVWVLGLQTNLSTVIKILMMIFLLGFSMWIYGKSTSSSKSKRIKALSKTVTVIILGYALYIGFSGVALSDNFKESAQNQTLSSSDEIVWQEFSLEKLEEFKLRGQPVFIDFTAAWCLTCQVNERTTFHHPEVIRAFVNKGVIPLKADWTKRDPVITRFLARFGRSGVPFYVLFPGPADREPIVLPEIITPGIVLEALGKI